MDADRLATSVADQLRQLDVIEYELTRYVPCAATTADGEMYDRVIVIDREAFIRFVGEPDDPDLTFVAAAKLTSILPSAHALQGALAQEVGRCQEARMGSTLIHLRLDDGSEFLYETGTPAFPDLPSGRQVVGARCADTRDEQRFNVVRDKEFVWCLISNGEVISA